MKTIPNTVYGRIGADIIDDIRAGLIAPGDPIPSVRELMANGYRGTREPRDKMALFTAQRIQRVVKDSGLAAPPEPAPGKSVSGRRIYVLPEDQWPSEDENA